MLKVARPCSASKVSCIFSYIGDRVVEYAPRQHWILGEGRGCCLIDSVNRLNNGRALFFYTRERRSWVPEIFAVFLTAHNRANVTEYLGKPLRDYFGAPSNLEGRKLWKHALGSSYRGWSRWPTTQPTMGSRCAALTWSEREPSKKLEQTSFRNCTIHVKLLKLVEADRKTGLFFT